MRISIGVRLFAMALLSMTAVAGLGVLLMRWGLADGGAPLEARAAQSEIDGLTDGLAAIYRARGHWPAAPAGPQASEDWWRILVKNATPVGGMPALPDRARLLDADGRALAGYEASPLLIALVSLDRIRRAIEVDGRIVGYVTVAQPHDAGDALTVAFLIRQQRHLLWLMLCVLLLSAAAAAWLARQIRQPVKVLASGARRLGDGQLDARIELRRRDELGDLADIFHLLASRLKAADEARRRWLADTSHELRTPLAVLRAQLEAMQDGVRAASPENMAQPLSQVAALSSLVEDLHLLALGDAGALPLHPVSVDVGALARDAWQSFAPRLGAQGLHGSFREAPADAMAKADPQRLRQVVMNLLDNSLRYTAPGGRVAMAVAVESDNVQVELDDSAPGVAGEALARLGERFFRAEPSRDRRLGGAGLGLALSRQWMQAQGGDLHFEPSPLGGLRVRLLLPREQ